MNRRLLFALKKTLYWCWYLLLLVTSFSCSQNERKKILIENIDDYVILQTPKKNQTRPRGILYLIHGLNINPQKMNALMDFFLENNYYVLKVILPGHEIKPPLLEDVNLNDWKRVLDASKREAKRLQGLYNLPLIGLGISMGGQILVESLLFNDCPFQKLILIAPSLELIWYTSLMKSLLVFPGSWKVPSFAPYDYRAQKNGVPISLYESFFELHQKFQDEVQIMSSTAVHEKLNSIPLLIFLHRHDELVSFDKIHDWKNKYHLSNWEFVDVDHTSPQIGPRFNHLMLDEATMGQTRWQELKNKLRNFLQISKEEMI